MSAVSKAHSRVANEVKKAGGDSTVPPVQDAKRALAEEKLKAYIERVVAEAPPLSVEARQRLALLLRAEQ